MTASPRDDYLVQQVMTATPQKLQLMLIEAALRHAQQAERLWQSHDDQAAGEALVRSQQIVTELLCGLNPERDRRLVNQVAGVYLFIFRALTEAQLRRSEQRLAEAVRLLEIERETWQQICRKLDAQRAEAQLLPSLDRVLEA